MGDPGPSVIAYLPVKGQLKASTPAEYRAQLEEPRKVDAGALDSLLRKLMPN